LVVFRTASHERVLETWGLRQYACGGREPTDFRLLFNKIGFLVAEAESKTQRQQVPKNFVEWYEYVLVKIVSEHQRFLLDSSGEQSAS
jgi:hypothetical protein